jgi:hypothetical protein
VKLEKTIHVALDEVRMQMLGTEVLFGFQLQGAFQERFALLSTFDRGIAALALGLLVLTLGLLIAGPCQHRLVERGNATVRILHVANRFAETALAPFALALGADFYVIAHPYWGPGAGYGGTMVTILAICFWYATGLGLRVFVSEPEQEKLLPTNRAMDLHEKINQMLTEARVILPGAQALLGFQFAVTMTRAFAELPQMDRQIHFIALVAIAVAVMLLLTPATVHRLTFGGKDVARFHDIGSGFVTAALAPLGLGITADVYVATAKMLDSHFMAAIAAITSLIFLALFWYAIPLLLRARHG